jgi:protein phosphatase
MSAAEPSAPEPPKGADPEPTAELEIKQPVPPKYRVSTTIKSIDGGVIRDHSLADILSRSCARPDTREADTPVQKGRGPPNAFPAFRAHADGTTASALDPDTVFSPDAITTPHTFARVTAPGTPRKSASAARVLSFLRAAWDDTTRQFDYRTNSQIPHAFAQDVLQMCSEAAQLFEAEPVYLALPPNIFVLGDIHGNYADLHYFMTELLLFGDIELTPHSFLALGDYVDRGEHSVECAAMCLALKCLSPATFFMLRGNHEDPGINGDMDTYGADCFQAQAKHVLGDDTGMAVWSAVNAAFRLLPLAACIDSKIFCSHGGIPRYYGPPENDDRIKILKSPDFPRLRSLFEPLDMSVLGKERMERFWVAAFDLLWSDPSDDDSEMNEYGFGRNDRGNCIITFSEVAVDSFLTANGLELMFRAHQEKSDGLKLSKSAKCLTIFSSSNYQGHGNGAGVVYVSPDGKIKLILKEPH